MPAQIRYGDRNPVNTWSISNFSAVAKFISGSVERATVLVGDRPHVLAAVLGPRQQTWVGGSANNRFSIWRVDAEGLPIWVLCSKRGTTYEIEHPGNPWDGSISEDDVMKTVRFLARLYLQMEQVEPVTKYGPVKTELEDPILAGARVWLNSQAVDGSAPTSPKR